MTRTGRLVPQLAAVFPHMRTFGPRMSSRFPSVASASHGSKRRIRRPILRALRAWPAYRALSRLPRNDVVGCEEYVSGGPGSDTFQRVFPGARAAVRPPSQDPGDGGRVLPEVAELEFPEASVARLAGCRLYSRGVAVVGADERLLAEGSVHIGGTPSDHAIMGRFWLPAAIHLPGTTVLLSAPAGATYYHWMYDVLPRIALLRAARFDWKEADRIVVSSFRSPFQRETLEILGVPVDKVVEGDSLRHASCERLVLPSYPGTSGFPPLWACRFLRESFLGAAEGTGDRRRRIYVSRARSRGRGVANETEVRAAAEKAGCETVFPEEMSVRGQAELFAASRAVVAPHGSGLANLVFCAPGTFVLELFPPGFHASHYWVLSRQAGLAHRALVGSGTTLSEPNGNFRVDPGLLTAALATLG